MHLDNTCKLVNGPLGSRLGLLFPGWSRGRQCLRQPHPPCRAKLDRLKSIGRPRCIRSLRTGKSNSVAYTRRLSLRRNQNAQFLTRQSRTSYIPQFSCNKGEAIIISLTLFGSGSLAVSAFLTRPRHSEAGSCNCVARSYRCLG